LGNIMLNSSARPEMEVKPKITQSPDSPLCSSRSYKYSLLILQ